MGQKKKNRSMVSAEDRRQKQNSTGKNSTKTRSDAPASRAQKAAAGNRMRSRR